MRKVKYPLQLDVSELVSYMTSVVSDIFQLTDSLRDQTRPITAALKTALQARDDRAKQIKQLRGRNSPEELTEAGTRSKEKEQYSELVSNLEQADAGCNPSSMYELCGESWSVPVVTLLTRLAVVSHKGASADSGKSLVETYLQKVITLVGLGKTTALSCPLVKKTGTNTMVSPITDVD